MMSRHPIFHLIRVIAQLGLGAVILFDSCWAEDDRRLDSLRVEVRESRAQLSSDLTSSSRTLKKSAKDDLFSRDRKDRLSPKTREKLRIELEGDIKKTGGNDLGGGEANEVSFVMEAYVMMNKISLLQEPIQKAGILTAEQILSMKNIIPQWNVVVQGGESHLQSRYQVVIDPKEWNQMTVNDRRDRVLETLMIFAGFSEDEARHKTLRLHPLKHEKPGKSHRIDIIRKEGDVFWVQIDRNSQQLFPMRMRQVQDLFVFEVDHRGSARSRRENFVLDPNSFVFQWKPCVPQTKSNLSLQWEPFLYFENFANTTRSCYQRLRNGQLPRTIWTSESGAGLVLLCSQQEAQVSQ